MGRPGLIEIAIVVMAGLNVVMILLTVAVKVARSLRESWLKARRSRIESALDDFLLAGEVRPELRRLRARELDVLAATMIEYLTVLRGSERERLLGLAVELGLVKRYAGWLSSQRRWRRARAAENLGYLGGSDSVGGLAKLLSDRDETVRAVAARALARIGTQEAAQALAQTLNDPSDLTRLRVAENLERIGPLAAPSLIDLLSSEERRSPILAARVLGNLRLLEAGPALEAAARTGTNVDLRAQATLALGKTGDPEYVPVLLEAAKDEEWPVRAQAANALRMIGEVSTIPTLKNLMADREWWVRVNAARALANFGAAGERALVDILEGEDRFARERAAATLEAQGITRRMVDDLASPGERGERARHVIRAMVKTGSTRHLRRILNDMPEGDNRRVLKKILAENNEL